MKAGVIGYGVQGSAVVSILEKTSDITEIIVIDSSSDKIRRCEKVSGAFGKYIEDRPAE